MKTILITKHIHSCFASTDVWLRCLTSKNEIDFPIKKNTIIHSKKYPFLNGEKIKETYGDELFTEIIVEENKRFYIFIRGRHEDYSKTPEFKSLIKSYTDKGWSDDRETIQEKRYYLMQVEYKQALKDKKKGIVLWKPYEKLTVKDFQGGLSNSVFNSPKLKEYIGDGKTVFGWVGSSDRKKEHDVLIEQGLRERGISDDGMFNWLSSSDGRHFGDSLGGYSLKEQIKKINKYLNVMFNTLLIYSHPKHGEEGYETKDLYELYSSKEILLPVNTIKYNKKAHLKALKKCNITLP